MCLCVIHTGTIPYSAIPRSLFLFICLVMKSMVSIENIVGSYLLVAVKLGVVLI